MDPLPNEPALIASAKQGDKTAVSTLYQAYAQAIFQYISYRVATDTIAEDITAEVFLRMLRNLPNYQYTGAPLGAWLYRIAANLITDHYRRSGRSSYVELSDNLHHDEASPAEQLVQEEERQQLRLAIQSLSEDYQNVITLRFIQNLSHAEVAEIMGRAEGNIRVMQHRALNALEIALTKIQAGGIE